MSKLTYRELDGQLMALYREKEYASVIERVGQEQANFPERRDALLYWRLCMQSLLNNSTEALQTLREALEQGYWYSPRWLKEDSDLATLQEIPEFQEMVEICRQRLAEIQADIKPELLTLQPGESAAALPLVIGMHGNGGNARETLEQWEGLIEQGWLVAVPQSSQIAALNSYVWNDREPGIAEIRAHLAALQSSYKVDLERVVLGGFSMGGGQAVWMALHQSIKTRGFVVLGPYLTPAELEALPALLETQKPEGPRGYILIGEKDTSCLEVSRKVVEIMNRYGLSCEMKILPGLDHSYPPDFVELVAQGLAFVEQA